MLKETLKEVRSELRIPKIAATVVGILVAGACLAWLSSRFPLVNQLNKFQTK